MNPNRPSDNRKNRPRDAAFALTLSALFALLFAEVYGGANLLAGAVPWHVRPALAFEAAIPFLPAAATVYLSLPLLLVCCALRADRRGAWTLFAVLCAELLAAAPFFVLLPVETAWPPRVAAGVWRPFFLLADALSLPRNHFPSLHTAFALTAAWFAWRQKFPRRAWLGAWAAAVVASTLLIREHHLADLAGGLMAAGYCFLQAFDDLMDGDRPSEKPPAAEAARLIGEWQRSAFYPRDRYSRLAAHFRGRLNAVLPPETAAEAVFQTASLLHTMRRDRLRAERAELWTAAEIAAQHRTTFSLSLDLLFAAAGASARSRDLPELADALGWCSTMRDLREDLAAGIVNIPMEIWQAAGWPCAAVHTEADGGFQTVSIKPNGVQTQDGRHPAFQTASAAAAALSVSPVMCRWIRAERCRALALLDAFDQRAAALPDPAARRIARLFARSVRGFADKRMRRLYPWL